MGPKDVIIRDAAKASNTDSAADVMTIAGRADTSKLDRNSASRVALAAIW